MSIIIHEADWQTIPSWQIASLAAYNEPGLFRFLCSGAAVYYGYAASPRTGIATRLYSYRRGDNPHHRAAQEIYHRQFELEAQYLLLDMPRRGIKVLCHDIIRREQPPLNDKEPTRGRH